MPATDDYSTYAVPPEGPYRRAAAITLHDTNELANVTRAIYVGGAGSIVLVTVGGDTITLTAAVAGSIIPIAAKIVKSTGATATNLVALW